jgi:AcrR family transcriptional regulator
VSATSDREKAEKSEKADRREKLEKGDKRESILQAALELFAERGFHGTVVPLVAERARVGTGTLYRYFESKEALVNTLFRRWKSALFESMLRELPLDLSPRQQFHELWQRLCRFALDNPVVFSFLELHHHQPYLDEENLRLEENSLRMMQALVQNAQAQHAMKPVASELLMSIIYGSFVGLMKSCRLGYLQLTPRAVDEAEQLVWEAVRV